MGSCHLSFAQAAQRRVCAAQRRVFAAHTPRSGVGARWATAPYGGLRGHCIPLPAAPRPPHGPKGVNPDH